MAEAKPCVDFAPSFYVNVKLCHADFALRHPRAERKRRSEAPFRYLCRGVQRSRILDRSGALESRHGSSGLRCVATLLAPPVDADLTCASTNHEGRETRCPKRSRSPTLKISEASEFRHPRAGRERSGRVDPRIHSVTFAVGCSGAEFWTRRSASTSRNGFYGLRVASLLAPP